MEPRTGSCYQGQPGGVTGTGGCCYRIGPCSWYEFALRTSCSDYGNTQVIRSTKSSMVDLHSHELSQARTSFTQPSRRANCYLGGTPSKSWWTPGTGNVMRKGSGGSSFQASQTCHTMECHVPGDSGRGEMYYRGGPGIH